MPTTTNYGWTTPADTDLVKDGASAIRTLGTAIDTTTKNLNPETTLGDIAYRSSTANTNTRLALGTAGQVLTVNSGATAPEWTTIAAGGMTLINTGGTTLTGASVSISSIPSTYKNLQLVIRNARPATDNTYLNIRFNSDSTTAYARLAGFNGGAVAANANLIYFSYEPVDNGASNGLSIIDIFDYANSATWKLMTSLTVGNNPTTTTQANYTNNPALWYNTSAINEITLFPDSGNWTSGTAYLYGVK